jgi:molecular chaperone DnaK
MARDNRTVGRFHLDGIPPAQRGVPQIEVTFDMDANGMLSVSAMDKGTGKQQTVRIEAGTGLSKEEVARMKAEAEMNADSDRQARDKVEKLNMADSLIFQTEKQLKEYGEKLPAEKKETIENALDELREAHKMQEISAIDTAMERLNAAWQAASQEMYQDTQAGGAAGGEQAGANAQGEETISDAEYEEVK